jgi:hypothetical protein
VLAVGKIKGKVVVLQLMGTMPDGKLHFVAGQDEDVFNIEEGDKFFTAVFTTDPFAPEVED